MMRRSMVWVSLPAMVLALAACGSDGEADESTTETTTASSQTTTTESTTESATEATTSSSSSSTSSATTTTHSSSPTSTTQSSSSATGGDGAATQISSIWVDDSWSIERLDEDVCAAGGLTESSHSHQDELFTCGPNAVHAMACTSADGGETTCITDPVEHKGIRFTSPTVDSWDGQMHPRGVGPIPMYVDLPDGARCEIVTHDHDTHWGGKYSWYTCDDGSELLTGEEIAGTFDDDGDTWTVQRSVDKGEPTQTPVTTAVFAGTR